MAIHVLLFWFLASLVWAALFIAGTVEGWWRRPLAAHGDARLRPRAPERAHATLAFGVIDAIRLIRGSPCGNRPQ